MQNYSLVAQFALNAAGRDPRVAASDCLTAGISLLALCQAMSPIADPDKMLDEMFVTLREGFHNMHPAQVAGD